jgi:hypothetical protein
MEKIKAIYAEFIKWLAVLFAVLMFLTIVGALYYVDHLRFCH